MTEDRGAEQRSDQNETEEKGEQKQPFLAHLEELRKRIIRSVLAIIGGMLICWFWHESIFDVLAVPVIKAVGKIIPPTGGLETIGDLALRAVDSVVGLVKATLPFAAATPADAALNASDLALGLVAIATGKVAGVGTFIALNPTESFFAYLKVSALAGFVLALPFVFYQIWRFIAPGLYHKERRMLTPFMGFGTLFFIIGGLFCYFVVLPYGLEFLGKFGGKVIEFKPSVKAYLSFTVRILFAFGIIFELPVVLFFLGRLGLVTASGLHRFRKYAILLAFVCSAILTPPDVFTQLLMAGPIIVLYEISILLVKVAEKRSQMAEEEDEAQTGA